MILIEAMSPNEEYAIAFEAGPEGILSLIDVKKKEIITELYLYKTLEPALDEEDEVFLIWNDESSRAGLVVNDELWGLFDLNSKRMMGFEQKEEIIPIDSGFFHVGIYGQSGIPFLSL